MNRNRKQQRAQEGPEGSGRVVMVHCLKGRVRFRVSNLKRSPSLAVYLEREMGRRNEVYHVSASAVTGSVLIRFDVDLDAPAMEDRLERALSDFLASSLGSSEMGQDHLQSSAARPGTALEKFERPWHHYSSQTVLDHFSTTAQKGLSQDAVLERRAVFGFNLLPGTTIRPLGEILRSQFLSTPIFLVGGSAVLSLITGKIGAGFLGLAVALTNAAIGFILEMRAEMSLGAARRTASLETRVLREGQLLSLPFEEVVPGDVVHLQAGCRVPADIRLIECESLGVDESALTGESLPVYKSHLPVEKKDALISQQSNMIYRGTLVVEGGGRGVVVAVGKDTVLGRLQCFLGEVLPPEAVMVRDMTGAGAFLLKAGLISCGLFALLSLSRGLGFLTTLRDSLTFLAGTLPSGLSTIASSGLALACQDMDQHDILIRRLRALGNLSSINMVCFDKTGTLTLNRMTASELYLRDEQVRVEGKDFWTSQGKVCPKEDPDLTWLLILSVLCNEAFAESRGAEAVSLEGSSTEKALISLGEQAGFSLKELRARYPLLDMVHRTEAHPFMVTAHKRDNQGPFIAVKGNPIEVLERCTLFRSRGRNRPLMDRMRHELERANFQMAGQGLRVLGVAYRPGYGGPGRLQEEGEKNLVWAGLVGLEDPLRPGAKELIQFLHRAHIRTAVITGDQSLTAQHIGEELGVSGEEPLRILDGPCLQNRVGSGMEALPIRTHVFARVTPHQKLQIIQSFQRSGMGVAMVGDGINDVLALKVADVGIALGKDGAELARQTADLVLREDDLLVLGSAIAGGRAFYDNVTKSLRFLLTTSHMDILSALAERTGLPGADQGVLQGLWTNLVCLSLAMDPPRENVLEQHPREAGEGVMDAREIRNTLKEALVMTSGAGVAGLGGRWLSGLGPGLGNLFGTAVSTNELLYALKCRETKRTSPSGHLPNPMFRATLTVALGTHLLTPVLRGIEGGLRGLITGITGTGLLVVTGLLALKALSGNGAPLSTLGTGRHEGGEEDRG